MKFQVLNLSKIKAFILNDKGYDKMKLFRFMNKKQVRRYNFIVGTQCLYSGLFTKHGWFDFLLVGELAATQSRVSRDFNVPVEDIKISGTYK